MAVNLRLRPEAVEALRAEAERTGASHQEILRKALDEYLRLVPHRRPRALPDWIEPPREPFRSPKARLTLPGGLRSQYLLSEVRADRL